MTNIKYFLAGFVGLLVLGIGVGIASASITFKSATGPTGTYEVNTLLTATTTTATSTNLTGGGGYQVIAGAKDVVFYFSRGDTTGTGNSGSTNFKVQVSPDGALWYDYNTLVQNSATSTDITTLSSVTISAATSTVITYPQEIGFYAVRCIAVETTDGEHTCKVGVTR